MCSLPSTSSQLPELLRSLRAARSREVPQTPPCSPPLPYFKQVASKIELVREETRLVVRGCKVLSGKYSKEI